ncbi:MAG: peptidoglycan-binding protein, partial [bacterium]
MKKKIFISMVSLLAVFGFLFFVTPTAKAMTAAEIQALINQLQAQIVALQQQLAATQSQPVAWCHTFNVNLKYGDTGVEVEELQTALKKEGATSWDYKGYDGEFDEVTASAVVGFQEKYKDEVLSPWGLKNGT